MRETRHAAGGVGQGGLPLYAQGQTDHPIFGQVNYTANEVGDDPEEQVKGTIKLMCLYALEDAVSPEIQAEAGDVRWKAGIGATGQELVRQVWKKVQDKIQFLRDEASGAQVEKELDKTVIEILVRPRDMAAMAARARVGDCDDYSMYAASILTALGIPCSFTTVAGDSHNPSIFTHVYVVAYPDGVRIPVDASHGRWSGWEAKDGMTITRTQEWPLDNPMANCSSVSFVGAAVMLAAVAGLVWYWGRG